MEFKATLILSIPSGNASFIVNPTLACCGINYSCSVFNRDRKTHQHPCVSTWRLLLTCPMTCILLVLKTHNSHRPSSWTLFTNHWIISTAAFLFYLSVIFKLDIKVHHECKLGALSFGWTCFASEATACKDACFGFPYSTTPSRRFYPQCATIYLVRIFKFFKFSCHFVSQGWVWRYSYLVVRPGRQMAVWTGPLYKTDVALHSVTLSESGTVLDPGTKDTVPQRQCLSLTREINAQLPNYCITEMPWNQ